MNLTSLTDVDAVLREAAALRGMLDGLGQCIADMKVVLARRELALTSAREELTAHFADLAARAAERQRVA